MGAPTSHMFKESKNLASQTEQGKYQYEMFEIGNFSEYLTQQESRGKKMLTGVKTIMRRRKIQKNEEHVVMNSRRNTIVEDKELLHYETESKGITKYLN